MMSVRERQKRRAPSMPSFFSFSWKTGRNAFMSVLPLMLRSIRQMTNVRAVNDIRSMGNAKYQSSETNFRNADMRSYPSDQKNETRRRTGTGGSSRPV